MLGPSDFTIRSLTRGRGSSYTLPFSHRRSISHLASNHDGSLLLSIDDTGSAILTHLPRRLALFHFSFRAPVSALAFSPSGRYFAVGVGHLVEVWHAPSTPAPDSDEGLEFAPFVRRTVHAGHHDTVESLEWSSDSRFLLSTSKDLTARMWSLGAHEGFAPTTLGGHREAVMGAWFSADQESVGVIRTCSGLAYNPQDIHCKSRWSSVPMAVCAVVGSFSRGGRCCR